MRQQSRKSDHKSPKKASETVCELCMEERVNSDTFTFFQLFKGSRSLQIALEL